MPADRASLMRPLLFAAYVVLMALIVWQMFALRVRVLADLSRPAAREDWQRWRERAERQSPAAHREARFRGDATEPVQRSVPKSGDPNLLVLFRDYFATCLVAAILFSSLLFAVTVFFLRGAASQSTPDAKQVRSN